MEKINGMGCSKEELQPIESIKKGLPNTEALSTILR